MRFSTDTAGECGAVEELAGGATTPERTTRGGVALPSTITSTSEVAGGMLDVDCERSLGQSAVRSCADRAGQQHAR